MQLNSILTLTVEPEITRVSQLAYKLEYFGFILPHPLPPNNPDDRVITYRANKLILVVQVNLLSYELLVF